VVEVKWWIEFGFEAKLAWGYVGRCIQAYIGVWEESEALGFELEIKSEFNLKIKSRKIWRSEFVLDKIEGRDSKRVVMCICFGHPMKKNKLVRGSPWEGSHGRSWSSMADHGELAGEEGEGEEAAQLRGGGTAWGGGGGAMKACRRGGSDLLLLCSCILYCT
jgi:hypothetical protein